MRLRTFLAATLALLLLLTAVTWGYLQWQILPLLPSQQEIEDIELQRPLRVLARDDSLIATFGEKRRIPLQYREIPTPMIQAILAAEDEHYFEHPGIDPAGIARAAIDYLISGEKRQGGSTITMQMARNFFLTREKSWERKIKELLLALRIEQTLNKEEILTLYLNKIFLGHRSYGIGAAFQTYYGVTPAEATLAQSAMIAALPKAPSTLNPIRNPKRAKVRRDYVLDRMRRLGFINKQQWRKAKRAPLSARLRTPQPELVAPYGAEMVRAELVRLLGEQAYTQGITVRTTLEPQHQRAANRALQTTIHQANQRQQHLPEAPSLQGALVALAPNNGAITALVGGTDFTDFPFNRATQSKRQMGSTIKPLLYTVALQQGKSSATLINDAPLVFSGSSDFPPWRPENAGLRFNGPTLLEDGLVYSRNLVSIRLLQQIGFSAVERYLIKLGFPKARIAQHRDLTLAIGTLPASPLEVATSYAPFANGGYRVSPYLIQSIEPSIPLHGCTLCRSRQHQRVMSAQLHYLMDRMLRQVIQRGTAQAARKLKRKELGGKTGTSNRAVDTWFAGYHPDLVTVTWVGYDQPAPLGKGESGSETALPMWNLFMEEALKSLPERSHPKPEGIRREPIDLVTGKIAAPDQRRRRWIPFRAGFQPQPTTHSLSGRSQQQIEQEAAQLW